MRLTPIIVNGLIAGMAWFFTTKAFGGPEWAGYLMFAVVYFNLMLRGHITDVRR